MTLNHLDGSENQFSIPIINWPDPWMDLTDFKDEKCITQLKSLWTSPGSDHSSPTSVGHERVVVCDVPICRIISDRRCPPAAPPSTSNDFTLDNRVIIRARIYHSLDGEGPVDLTIYIVRGLKAPN